jgi:hypothetical protein
MARIELKGKVTCIHHSSLQGEVAPGLNIDQKTLEPKRLAYSIIDVKVGRHEMRIIRPMTKRFEWKRDSPDEEVKSGDVLHIILEKRR